MSEPNEILLALEKGFPAKYREYYEIKRNNLFAGITQCPEIWDCFMQLDGLFASELDDIAVISDLNKTLPLMLFAHAHAQFRISIELGFGGSFCESFNIARMAIESAYQACKVIRTPDLNDIWFKKDRGKIEEKAFRTEFDFEKREGYAGLGLEKLHEYWSKFSIWSHTSVSALNQRFTPFAVHYFETDTKLKSLNLNELLYAFHKIENALFDAFESRLKLDIQLEAKRLAFVKKADETRLVVIRRFGIKAPPEKP